MNCYDLINCLNAFCSMTMEEKENKEGMEQNTNKPLCMRINDLKNIIINAVNASQLNPAIIEMVVRDLYMDIKNQCIALEKEEQANYEKLIADKDKTKQDETA